MIRRRDFVVGAGLAALGAWSMVESGVFAKGRPPDLDTFIPDLNVANRYEVLAATLSARGHSDARIAKILGDNFARVMREVWG